MAKYRTAHAQGTTTQSQATKSTWELRAKQDPELGGIWILISQSGEPCDSLESATCMYVCTHACTHTDVYVKTTQEPTERVPSDQSRNNVKQIKQYWIKIKQEWWAHPWNEDSIWLRWQLFSKWVKGSVQFKRKVDSPRNLQADSTFSMKMKRM